LGFYEMLFTIGLTGVLYAVRNVRPFSGFHTALMMLIYSVARFPLDFLRIKDATYFGLTPAQYLSIVMAVLAVAMIVRGKGKPAFPAPAGGIS
jgi:prolipoprotein diacylglyceryltransferase